MKSKNTFINICIITLISVIGSSYIIKRMNLQKQEQEQGLLLTHIDSPQTISQNIDLSKLQIRDSLYNIINETNKFYPVSLGNGLTMVYMKNDFDYIIYGLVLDSGYELDMIRQNIAASKQSINNFLIVSVKDRGNKDILSLFYRDDKGIKYRYFENDFSDSLDITFTKDELQKILYCDDIYKCLHY